LANVPIQITAIYSVCKSYQAETIRRLTYPANGKLERTEPGQPMVNPATGISTRNNSRILVAEDEEVNQKIVQLILLKAGYHVDVVTNGQQAVEACKKNRYDLILMDIQLPVMDGHEATKRIRNRVSGMLHNIGENSDSNSDFKWVPIIAMTGDASMNSFDPKRYPGMNDCVGKPLQRDNLLSVIDRWIDCGSSYALNQKPINDIDTPFEKPDEPSLPIDLDRAIDEFMGKKKILYALLGQFMTRTGDQITGLRRAGCRCDYGVIASEAHRLKGGAANLRARRLSRAASDLEKAAESKKEEEICELIEKLAEEFHHLERFLRQKGL
jgi:two-component system sensor histidine kinase/response regulator